MLTNPKLPPIVFPPSELSERVGFCGNRLDRAAIHRDDAGWIAEQEAREDARLYLFLDGRIVMKIGDAGQLSVCHEAAVADQLGVPRTERVFLGLADDSPRFGASVGVDEETMRAAGPWKSIDFRSLVNQGLFDAAEVGAMAEARSLVLWHENHQFCARCGAPTALASAGWRRQCGSCGASHFPRTDPVVIMLVVDGDYALLGRQPAFLPGMYSALAGYVEPGETIEAAVRREIAEEAGIVAGRVDYYTSQPWPFPSTLMIGCFAEAVTREIDFDPVELEDCRWFSRAELVEMSAGNHTDGLMLPKPLAIAHWLTRAFIEM